MLSKQRVMKYFILRDHRGTDWHVKARSIGCKLYFDDGWKLFREEIFLEDNDFLVFTHIENNVFKFKIYELSSMCKKMKVMDGEENNNMLEDEEEEFEFENLHWIKITCFLCNNCFIYKVQVLKKFGSFIFTF